MYALRIAMLTTSKGWVRVTADSSDGPGVVQDRLAKAWKGGGLITVGAACIAPGELLAFTVVDTTREDEADAG